MQKIYSLLVVVLLLSACTGNSPLPQTVSNLNFTAALTDPIVQKDFHILKAAVIKLPIYAKAGKPYLSVEDDQKLDALTKPLIQQLQTHYHLDPLVYKVHSYIGRNHYNSCYQYYNSMHKKSAGQDCHSFAQEFSSCHLCNNYIKALRSRSADNIIQTHWWKNEETTSLVNTLKLSNGDDVYLGFELTVAK